MSAGGAADDADVGGVEVKAVGVDAKPANGGLAVVEVLWPSGDGVAFPTEAVVDTECGVTVGGERAADVEFARRGFVAAGPAAAVDDEDGGDALACGNLGGK